MPDFLNAPEIFELYLNCHPCEHYKQNREKVSRMSMATKDRFNTLKRATFISALTAKIFNEGLTSYEQGENLL